MQPRHHGSVANAALPLQFFHDPRGKDSKEGNAICRGSRGYTICEASVPQVQAAEQPPWLPFYYYKIFSEPRWVRDEVRNYS